jgi:hypothetical protein
LSGCRPRYSPQGAHSFSPVTDSALTLPPGASGAKETPL